MCVCEGSGVWVRGVRCVCVGGECVWEGCVCGRGVRCVWEGSEVCVWEGCVCVWEGCGRGVVGVQWLLC